PWRGTGWWRPASRRRPPPLRPDPHRFCRGSPDARGAVRAPCRNRSGDRADATRWWARRRRRHHGRARARDVRHGRSTTARRERHHQPLHPSRASVSRSGRAADEFPSATFLAARPARGVHRRRTLAKRVRARAERGVSIPVARRLHALLALVMTSAFAIEAVDGAARTGTLSTAHGPVRTPAFMPVGTHATVKALDPGEVRASGVDILLCNAYHLGLRPGIDVIEAAGGLHAFMGWDHPIL